MTDLLESNKKFYENEIFRLEKALKGEKYSDEQLYLLFNAIRRYKTSHLKKTIDFIIFNRVFRPPIIEIVNGCRSEALEEERFDNKRDEQFAQKFMSNEISGGTEMEKESRNLCVALLHGRITMADLPEKMKEMAKKYPGKGWEQEEKKIDSCG
jgi:hypothetical protein